MLTKKEINEIKEHLEKSQNPLFLFDNDQDGLCSFLLLRRYIGRGRGVPIKSFPDLISDYFRKVKEFGSDCIFILDKPVISEEFFKEAKKINIPIVWIDHHFVDKKSVPSFVNYYNPLFNKSKIIEPTTDLCYQVTNRKEDLWIAIIGCVSDKFIPDFYKEFEDKYPDLSFNSSKLKNPFDVYYKSEIGKIARIIGFSLKDRTTSVVNMIRFLTKVKDPYEVLNESSQNRTMHQRFKQIDSKFQKLIQRAKSINNKNSKNFSDENLLFFQYSSELSISGDISNELSYSFPEKTIVVLRIKGLKASISMRGKNVREIFSNSIKDLKDARGGGHEEAIGGQIHTSDVEKFLENIKKSVNLYKKKD
ncbi:hypothetical protein K0A97_00120 [Patescibacteria group bacterium]|nr:hypothetical protein [Patescibacteria group bacterium]